MIVRQTVTGRLVAAWPSLVLISSYEVPLSGNPRLRVTGWVQALRFTVDRRPARRVRLLLVGWAVLVWSALKLAVWLVVMLALGDEHLTSPEITHRVSAQRQTQPR